jgi:hypothetical protein
MAKARHCRRCGREFTGFACPRCHPRRQRSGGRSQGSGSRRYRVRPEDVLWRGLADELMREPPRPLEKMADEDTDGA